MPAGYTPIQRTWTALLNRADDELDDNTSRDITAQIMRELVMDFMYTTQQLGSLSIADTDGDTSIAVELTDDDDTIRFTSGSVVVGTMTNSGGFPTMSFGGLPFGAGIEMATAQVRLRSYGGPVARFGDNGSSGSGFYLGDLDADFNPISGGNFIQYEGDLSGIYISASELSLGKVGQDNIAFPGHATIKSNSPATATATAMYLDASGRLRQGPVSNSGNVSADGSVRWVLGDSQGATPQAILEFSDSSLSAAYTPVIKVNFTGDQQVDISESLPGATGMVPTLEWGILGRDSVGFNYQNHSLLEVGQVSGGTNRVIIGDVDGNTHESYIIVTDGEMPSGFTPAGEKNIEINSPNGITMLATNPVFELDFNGGGVRMVAGDVEDEGNGTRLVVADATQSMTFNRSFFLTNPIYTTAPAQGSNTTTALTVDPSTGQLLLRNISASTGATSLNALSDVNTANKTLADNDALLYNTTASEFQAVASVNIFDPAGHPTGADLTLLTTGGNWDANNLYTGTALAGTYDAGIKVYNGQYLYEYDGTNWHRNAKTASAGSVTSIDDLSDVDTTTAAPTDGQALVWSASSSNWVPGTVSGGGGASAVNDLTDGYTSSGVFGLISDVDFAGLVTDGKDRITIIGQNAGSNYRSNVTSNAQVDICLVGFFAGNSIVDGHRTTAVGSRSGMDYDGNNSTIMGWEAGRNATGNNNILIGGRAGFSETISNAFIVAAGGDFLRIVRGTPNIVRIPLLNAYADETAATTAGLVQGDLYYNSTSNHVDQVRS